MSNLAAFQPALQAALEVAPTPEPQAPRNWSPYQLAIFDFVENGTGNAVVEAVAGSGKSTTIVEALNRVQGSSIFLAFNKSIADELKARGVNARTFHSLTYSAVLQARKARTVDADKLRRLVDANMSGNDARLYGAFAQRMVGLARQLGVGCLVPDTQAVWMDIAIYHDIEPEHEHADIGRGLELASELLDWSNSSPLIDFDDLLYFAVRDGISLPKFDFVFVDEAQDTNAIQRALLRKILKKDARVVAVGDPAQAIYGFRGADSESLNMIADEFNAVRLPLTVSYRCPLAVVKHAQQWVDHIEAAPNAPEGSVEYREFSWKPEDFAAGELVVCRTTRPLIALGFRMLRARIPVQMLGREIGQGLKALVKKMQTNDVDQLITKLEAWSAREIEKALAKQQESKCEAIHDKASSLICLINSLGEDERTVEALYATLDRLFTDKGNATKLATIHKAKGLESDTVYWLNSSQCPPRWVRQGWQVQQELNLCYVATTRAKQRLVLIEEQSV